MSAEKYTPEENSVICLKHSLKSFYCAFFTPTLTKKDLKWSHENSIWINVGILSLHQGCKNSFDLSLGIWVQKKKSLFSIPHPSYTKENLKCLDTIWSFVHLFISPLFQFLLFLLFHQKDASILVCLCYFPLMKIQCLGLFSIIL